VRAGRPDDLVRSLNSPALVIGRLKKSVAELDAPRRQSSRPGRTSRPIGHMFGEEYEAGLRYVGFMMKATEAERGGDVQSSGQLFGWPLGCNHIAATPGLPTDVRCGSGHPQCSP
jgi:hypothetical protein